MTRCVQAMLILANNFSGGIILQVRISLQQEWEEKGMGGGTQLSCNSGSCWGKRELKNDVTNTKRVPSSPGARTCTGKGVNRSLRQQSRHALEV